MTCVALSSQAGRRAVRRPPVVTVIAPKAALDRCCVDSRRRGRRQRLSASAVTSRVGHDLVEVKLALFQPPLGIATVLFSVSLLFCSVYRYCFVRCIGESAVGGTDNSPRAHTRRIRQVLPGWAPPGVHSTSCTLELRGVRVYKAKIFGPLPLTRD